MARARNIKPGLYKNYELADLGPHAQLLFTGLWCLADREGRLEDKPRFIKAEIFPYYEVDVEGELVKLERQGFVARYVVEGLAIVQILNFKKHQAPHNTEKASSLPAQPPTDSGNNGAVTVKSRNDNDGNRPDSLIPDSLIPDSPISEPDRGEHAPTFAETPLRAFTAVDLSIAMRKCGVMTQPANPVLIALAEQGVSPETVTAACEEAKRAKPDEQIGPGYVFKIVERWAKDAAALKVAGATAPKASGGAWWASDLAIAAKGKEFGLTARGGERTEDFKARIQACIDNGGKPPEPPRSRIDAPAAMEPRGIKPAGLDLKALIRQPPGGTA